MQREVLNQILVKSVNAFVNGSAILMEEERVSIECRVDGTHNLIYISALKLVSNTSLFPIRILAASLEAWLCPICFLPRINYALCKPFHSLGYRKHTQANGSIRKHESLRLGSMVIGIG